MSKIDYESIAQEVCRHVSSVTGDCSDVYVSELEPGKAGWGSSVTGKMRAEYEMAKASVGYRFDAHGWVADYLHGDADFWSDMCGDKIGDCLSEVGHGWHSDGYWTHYNAVCDAIAETRTDEKVKEAVLNLKHDDSTEEVECQPSA